VVWESEVNVQGAFGKVAFLGLHVRRRVAWTAVWKSAQEWSFGSGGGVSAKAIAVVDHLFIETPSTNHTDTMSQFPLHLANLSPLLQQTLPATNKQRAPPPPQPTALTYL
jgi:hypothetical protein